MHPTEPKHRPKKSACEYYGFESISSIYQRVNNPKIVYHWTLTQFD